MRKRTTTPTWERPPPNPLFTSRTADPLIVSTKNQNKIPNAKATMYLTGTLLLAQVITNNPAKAGRSVRPTHAAKLSENPIMAETSLGRKILALWPDPQIRLTL